MDLCSNTQPIYFNFTLGASVARILTVPVISKMWAGGRSFYFMETVCFAVLQNKKQGTFYFWNERQSQFPHFVLYLTYTYSHTHSPALWSSMLKWVRGSVSTQLLTPTVFRYAIWPVIKIHQHDCVLVCRSAERVRMQRNWLDITTVVPHSLAMFGPAGFLMVGSTSAYNSQPAKKAAGFENNEHLMGHKISYNVEEMKQTHR